MSRTRAIAVGIGLVVLATPVTAANAAATRAEYVAQVEPICKAAQRPTFKAYAQLFKSGRKEPIAEGNPTASAIRISARALGRFYAEISAIYERTTTRLAAVPPAPGDEHLVNQWLAGRYAAVPFGIRAARAAKHRKFKRAIRLSNRGISVSEQAAMLVTDFGFTFCALPLGEARGR